MWYLWAGRQCRTHVIIKLPDIQLLNIQIAILLTVQLLQSTWLMSVSVLLHVTIWTPHCIHWFSLTRQSMHSCVYGAIWDEPLTCRNTSSQPIYIMQLPRVALWQPVVETGRARRQLTSSAVTCSCHWSSLTSRLGLLCSSCEQLHVVHKHFDTHLVCVITQQ